jgi:hypothetical protein
MKTIIKISFKNLKQNYLEVTQFIKDQSGKENICIKSRIANDLSLLGDDNYYMLGDFITKYNLDFSNFNYDEHFESEGELTMSLWYCLEVLFLPLYIIKGIVSCVFYFFSKKLSKKINAFNFVLNKYKSNRKDLTIGDLITSKIYGKFQMRENVKFIFH